MSFFSKLFSTEPDPRELVRPLWLQVIDIARTPDWYAQCKVADTVDGRFDMLTAILSVVLVRVEASDELRSYSSLITELFVEDMDGQLRELGTNDVVVGKRMGKVMAAMGGRLGAYRTALESNDAAGDANSELAQAAERNISFVEGGSAQCVAGKLLALSQHLAALDDDAILAAEELA
ncbi:MAG: ubiquinol-cytochrome C chaperone family protein [Erythrobacter sp.]